ncbi:LysR substrate-binding domain-containing protein [Aliiglaciecola sp. M165]|uniref:LysR substrate-binding domain-containing protein n=1 Tax=Aliiglaciecola sp. M165 TaxID=2593649 RepID=UPI00117F9832|nr:LysR substrate-binding domain-containing protein [Aliiglaciecola sp. M165]TRY32633.1 LysR family transcriptional regulator [Aliiglaciecola sp. M165]
MNQRLPPLKSLHFFLTAGKLKSFKLAAQKLNVTQAAVSQQIKLLEQQLNVQLFVRGTRQTDLTAEGQALLPHIDAGFEHFQEGISRLSSDPNPNILRVSTLYSFVSFWLMPRLQTFQQENPDIMVQLAPSNELVDFSSGDIDVAIRMGKGNYTGVKSKVLFKERLVFVASPDCVAQIDRQDPKQVFQLPWLEDVSRSITAIFNETCENFGIDRSKMVPIVRSNNSVPLIENAVAGRGFMLANYILVSDYLLRGELVTLLDFNVASPYSLFLVAPEHHFSWHKVSQFEKWLVPIAKENFSQ